MVTLRVDVAPLGAALVLSVYLCLMTPEFTTAETQQCVDISNNAQYTVDEMEGTWYPVEIVVHRNDSKIYGVPLDSQCPAVTFTKNKKMLVMVWNSTAGDLEYKFTQKGGRGPWQAVPEQKGSLAIEGYKHFGGFFHVLRLDGDNMFLSYCSKHYRILNTVAFSRSGTMSQEVIDETLKELENQKIKLSREIKVPPCGEGGYSHRTVSYWLLTILPSLVVRFPL